MKNRLIVLCITLLYQAWGNPKHFLIETKNDHEKPIKTKNNINVTDYEYDEYVYTDLGTDNSGK